MEQTGRQRATRIALDYHRRRDDLWHRRMRVAAIALILAAAFVGYALFAPRGQTAFSHGPLAEAHARWDKKCQACHQNLSAIHSRAWTANPAARNSITKKCTTCHAAAHHHAGLINEASAQFQSCSACHREHRGRLYDLNRVADTTCTACHADLERTRVANAQDSADSSISANVTAFAADEHPGFRSLTEDPGNVRFNHSLHLLPGIRAPDSRDSGLTYAELGDKYSEAERAEIHEQYRSPSGDDTQLVQLACADCHGLTPANADPNWHMSRERSLMERVKYSTHCKACHVLDYAVGPTQHTVPHGYTLSHVRQLLELGPAASDATSPDSALKIDQVMNRLQDKCAKCHEVDSIMGPQHRVTPPPQQWLRHAHFNHAAHTGVTCSTCHTPSTDAAAGRALAIVDGGTDQDRVMIRGIDVCLECHGKSGSSESIARSDCVECHRYHVDPLNDPDYGASTNRLNKVLVPK